MDKRKERQTKTHKNGGKETGKLRKENEKKLRKYKATKETKQRNAKGYK